MTDEELAEGRRLCQCLNLCEAAEAVDDWPGRYDQMVEWLVHHAPELLAAAERERELSEELIELTKSAFYEIAFQEDGWYCTNGRSTAVEYGDRLVELGVFEKDESYGVGRVQWYRPKVVTQ